MRHVLSIRYVMGLAIFLVVLAYASAARVEASDKITADSTVPARQDSFAKIVAHMEVASPQTMRQIQALQARCELDHRHEQSGPVRSSSAH